MVENLEYERGNPWQWQRLCCAFIGQQVELAFSGEVELYLAGNPSIMKSQGRRGLSGWGNVFDLLGDSFIHIIFHPKWRVANATYL